MIQVVYLTFGHDGVEPTEQSTLRQYMHSTGAELVCIKYAQTMAATKQIQVCEAVVLLMGKMHWSLWHLCN